MKLIQQDMYTNEFLREVINRVSTGIVITDPNQVDNPIIYVNQGFEKLTGYHSNDIVGKNCRFLQGDDTEQLEVDKLRNAIAKKESIVVILRNFKKNGEMFWNELALHPIYVGESKSLYFVGLQKDITTQKRHEEEIKQYIKEVNDLSTPIISVLENASILPIIGNLTEVRFHRLVNQIASYVSKEKEEYFIIDLRGLENYDEVVNNGLNTINQILILMGAKLVISGIKPKMARDIKQFSYENNLTTFNTCEKALEFISLNKI
ncbi:PAS domain-containing protein [Niallia taxi]|uniref:PAS domain-containing protein n=1 Tax=Niallia taxi TaxID=2499688 RepID=UPI003D26F378